MEPWPTKQGHCPLFTTQKEQSTYGDGEHRPMGLEVLQNHLTWPCQGIRGEFIKCVTK